MTVAFRNVSSYILDGLALGVPVTRTTPNNRNSPSDRDEAKARQGRNCHAPFRINGEAIPYT